MKTIHPIEPARCRLGLVASLLILGLPAFAAAAPAAEEFSLASTVFRNTRTIRVLLPPRYHDPAAAGVTYPACYFLDGRAAFDGPGWGLVKTATALWAAHKIPDVVFVGVDNGGSTLESTDPMVDRASEFLPEPDPSWTTEPAPTPRGKDHPDFLFTEVVPAVASRYRVKADAPICLAGDSYAAAAALYAAEQRPGRIQALLLESPPLHFGSLLADAQSLTAWPSRVYLGYGTAEGETLETQREMVTNARRLASAISRQRGSAFKALEVKGAAHGYDAWRARLKQALIFLLGSD
jgi:enterochelin esterase-like enzyme